MKRTMLVATEFDSFAPRLMDFCAGTRERGIASCILTHVVDTSGLEGPVIDKTIEDTAKRLNILAEPIRQAGIETQIRVLSGSPSYEILELARRESVDVIVVGTTAKTRAGRLFTGSVSDDVAFGQKAPTLLVRDDLLMGHEDAEKSSLDWSRKLVVPIDYSAASAKAVLQCTRFDAESVGEVRLLHILPPDIGGEELKQEISINEFRLSAFGRMLEDTGIKAVPVVRQGKFIDEVLAEISETQATGVVIGTNKRSLFSEVFVGSHAQLVVRTAPVYVMVVP